MSSIIKGLAKEDYTGIESGPGTGPFAAEKTPDENPYGGKKRRKFRGAISETPNETTVGDQPGGWREYSAEPAGLKEDDLETQVEKPAWKIRFRRFKNLPSVIPERENKVYLMPLDNDSLRTYGSLTGKDFEKIRHMPTEAYSVSGDAMVGDMSTINFLLNAIAELKLNRKNLTPESVEAEIKFIEELKKLYVDSMVPYKDYKPGMFRMPEILADPTQIKKLDKAVSYNKNTGELSLKNRKNKAQEAEAYKAHLIKTMPQMMNFLSKKVKGWTPGEEEMLGAIDTAYMVMKHTGDVKQAGKALMDELNTLHRMSQGKQGVEEGVNVDPHEIANKLTSGKNLDKLNAMAHDSTIYRALDRYFDKHGIPESIYNRVAYIVFKKLDDHGRRITSDPRLKGVAKEKCPHCDGPMFEASMMNEKQDACYYKVKSRYKVWPSAYASGALVQCRKKGASNWGTSGKKDESSIMKNIIDEAGNPAQQAAIAIAMKKAGKKPKNEGTYTAPGDTKLPIEEAYRKAREITKQIKYDQTVSEILVGIQMLAEKAGIPERELKYAEDAVYAASNALESAVYGLDEVFKEALDRQRYEQDDEEVDEDLGVRYAAALEEATNFAQQAAIMSMRKVGVQSKPIKESAESIEKLRKAISNRILSAHDDLLDEYGEVAVGRAIDEVSEEYGDNADQTITSQDITEFTKQVAEKVLNGSKKIEEGPSIFSGGYSGGAPRKYVAKPAGLNEAGDRAGAINTAAQLRKAIAAGKGQPHEIDLLKRQMNALVRKYNITPEELGDPNIGNKNRQQPPPPPPPGGQQRTQQPPPPPPGGQQRTQPPPPPPGGQQNAGGGYDWDKHMQDAAKMQQASQNAFKAAMAASSQGPWSMPNYNNSQPPPIPPEAMMKKESSIMKGLKK